MKTLIAAITTAMLIIVNPSYSVAAGNANADSICLAAWGNMNILLNPHQVSCFAANDEQNGYKTIIFVSLDPVFAAPAAKKGWLVVLIGAVGLELNKSPRVKIRNVAFMDKELARNRTYFTIAAKDVARLQKDVKADRLDLEGLYSGILAAGQVRSVDKKHLASGHFFW
jgi:hypothetical protein